MQGHLWIRLSNCWLCTGPDPSKCKRHQTQPALVKPGKFPAQVTEVSRDWLLSLDLAWIVCSPSATGSLPPPETHSSTGLAPAGAGQQAGWAVVRVEEGGPLAPTPGQLLLEEGVQPVLDHDRQLQQLPSLPAPCPPAFHLPVPAALPGAHPQPPRRPGCLRTGQAAPQPSGWVDESLSQCMARQTGLESSDHRPETLSLLPH